MYFPVGSGVIREWRFLLSNLYEIVSVFGDDDDHRIRKRPFWPAERSFSVSWVDIKGWNQGFVVHWLN